ncbi:MAG: CBS domain-containing protein, partial [Caldilineaceae bacterium]|nr:CBS domain-containing protein [Caldilineaceae bacterium]
MTKHLQTISEIMTSPPITVGPEMTLFDAYGEMHENGIRRLPVTAADGTLIGIVTLSDIQKTIPMLRDERDSETELLLNGQF